MATTNSELITASEWESILRMARSNGATRNKYIDYRDIAQEAALEVIRCRVAGKSTVSLRRSVPNAVRTVLRYQAGYSRTKESRMLRREVLGEDAENVIATRTTPEKDDSEHQRRQVRLEFAQLVRRTFSLEDRRKLRKLFCEGEQMFTEIPGMRPDNARKTATNFQNALIKAHRDPTYRRAVHLISFRGKRVKIPALAREFGLLPQTIRDRYHRGVRGEALIAPTGRKR